VEKSHTPCYNPAAAVDNGYVPITYHHLAGCYHLFFPAREAQLDFLASLASGPPARMLDVAAGTGEYMAALRQRGYRLDGVEIDTAMCAAGLKRHPELAGNGANASRLINGDMVELGTLVRGGYYLTYCIGNSLCHLDSDEEAALVLQQMWVLARPRGKVAVQLINFDQVLEAAQANDGVVERPVLSASSADGSLIAFGRWYEAPLRRAGDHPGRPPVKIEFKHVLRLGEQITLSGGEVLALTRRRLERLLPREAEAQWFGDFDGSPWTPTSPATIVVLSAKG
jgi:SAM-dependent methyltransferase